jgi:hypothetical protein
MAHTSRCGLLLDGQDIPRKGRFVRTECSLRVSLARFNLATPVRGVILHHIHEEYRSQEAHRHQVEENKARNGQGAMRYLCLAEDKELLRGELMITMLSAYEVRQ